MGDGRCGAGTGGNVILLRMMIKTRTSIRILKRVGIALIALPEPFTTPFGVALLLTSRYLSRRVEARQNNRLRETVRYYLAHSGSFDDVVGDEPAAPSLIGYPSSEHVIRCGYAGGGPGTAVVFSTWRNWQEMRCRTAQPAACRQGRYARPTSGDSSKATGRRADTYPKAEKEVRHTINVERLSQRYGSADGGTVRSIHSNCSRTPGAREAVTRHSINMGLLCERYGTGNVSQARMGGGASGRASPARGRTPEKCGTLRSALRSNNYYYDIVSRKNVIGGYPCRALDPVGRSAVPSNRSRTVENKREKVLRPRYAFTAG
jgi:hypothetical protein